MHELPDVVTSAQARRRFLKAFAGSAVALVCERALPMQALLDAPAMLHATLSVQAETPGFAIPGNFTGLSYEIAQLANPDFFSAANTALIRNFRELSPRGVLRLGGGTEEYATYQSAQSQGPPPFEVFGPDTSKTAKKGTFVTDHALHNLRAFLAATGWECLYGLNLGQGTVKNAADEAAAVHRVLGPRLLALQIGNEPDSFRNRFRPATWGPAEYMQGWDRFYNTVVQRVPSVRIAGPDFSNKLTFLNAFAQQAKQHPAVSLLTGHYYAMGPAGKPGMTIDNLLSADPQHSTLPWAKIPAVEEAMRTAGLPFRITEGNSCWNGGQAGVSDVFASAL